MRSTGEIFWTALKLGLTSFGGPTAHLGYFHNEYVQRKKWLDEGSYADLTALCQFLPGPSSSQVGIGIGILRGGWLGGLAAWLGFTLPSFLIMVGFAWFWKDVSIGSAGWVHGLKLVAIAIVAHAVLGMGQKLAYDRQRATLAVLAAAFVLLWPTPFTQVLAIGVAGALGYTLFRHAKRENPPLSQPEAGISRKFAWGCLILFAAMFLLLPLLRNMTDSVTLERFDGFYRAGSLVFGGGHVVLPLLEREVVANGWVSGETFLAGYGAAQALPGPLFTFAAFLGAAAGGLPQALMATAAVFLPGILLVYGVFPFWKRLRAHAQIQGALDGINAAVVGILLAALYDPLWVSTVRSAADFVLSALLFVMLVFWKLPPWVVVLAGATAGTVYGFFTA